MPGAHYVLTGEANDLVAEMERAKRSLYGAADAGNKMEKSTDKVGKTSKKSAKLVDVFKNAAEGVGGKAGESAGRIEKFGKALGGVGSIAGPVGLAVTGAAGVVLALGAGAVTAALNVSSLVKEMREANKHVPIDDDQLAQVKAMDQEISGLKDDLKELAVIVGAEVAPAIGATVGLLRDGIDAAQRFSDAYSGIGRVVSAIASAGITEIWRYQTEGNEAAGRAAREYLEALEKVGSAGDGPMLDAPVRKVEQLAKAHKAAEEAAKRQADATATLEGIYHSATNSMLDGESKIKNEHQERLFLITKAANDSRDFDLAKAARQASEAQMIHELSELEAERGRKQIESMQALAQMQKAQWEAEERAAEKRSDDEERFAQMQRDNAWATASAITGSIQAVAASRANADKDATESQKKAARRAFRIQQLAAAAAIVISTAQSISQTYGQLGFTPVGIAAAAGAGIAGGVQAAVVAGQSPPQFDQGGMVAPDHRTISASPGEAVLTRQGVAALGGPEGVRATNQARQAQPEPTYLMLDHRIYTALQRQSIEMGGPVAESIRETSEPPGQTLVGA